MKIAIHAAYNPTGGAITQLVYMIKYIALKSNVLDLIVYTTPNTYQLLIDEKVISNKYEVKICKTPGYSIIFRTFWEQLIFPFKLKYDKVDAIFCPGNISPIFTKVKTVQWIGTIGPFFKDFYSNFNLLIKIKLYLNKIIMSLSAQHADAVIFESIFTKDLFIKNYKIKPEKTHVLNIGKDVFFNPNGSNNKNLFLLCVSHLYPYKNILNMLEAYSKSQNMAGEKIDLIIAGSIDYKEYYFEIQKVIKRLSIGDNVHFLGKVSKKELKDLYSNCELMIFPSPFENFAYTLVEAMSCGAPIVCANTTAMPETCQDAALYFNPYDVEEMGEKISLILSDKNLRNTLKQKSLERAKELPDYKIVTAKTLDIISNLLKNFKGQSY